MKKEMTCISCPQGCLLTVEIEGGRAVSVTGNKCPRGEAYARQEIESPVRMISSTVAADGLDLPMVPVKTNRPIAKEKIMAVMGEINKFRLKTPVSVGDVLIKDVAGTGSDIVAIRAAEIFRH